MTIVPIIIDRRRSQATFDQLAIQVAGHRPAPAPLKDDITTDGFEVVEGQWCTVVETKGERVFRNGPILLQVHIRLENLRDESEVG